MIRRCRRANGRWIVAANAAGASSPTLAANSAPPASTMAWRSSRSRGRPGCRSRRSAGSSAAFRHGWRSSTSRVFTVVGLELWARSFPGGSPIRDAGHVKLVSRFRKHLHPAIGWSIEVPFPAAGDHRAWDAVVAGTRPTWRFGVEVETAPRDVQALARRVALKVRGGGVDGVIVVLPRSKHTAMFLHEARQVLQATFPEAGEGVLEALATGSLPRGNAPVVI